MEAFDDDFLPPITQQFNQSDDDSPTPILAIIFIIITIMACCSYSISGAIGNYIDTGEIIFPVADTDEKVWRRVYTQAQLSTMRISRPFILAAVVIFYGHKVKPEYLGHKFHLISVLFFVFAVVEKPISRIEFITEKGLFWYETIYKMWQFGYLGIVLLIYYTYFYKGVSPIRLNGSNLFQLLFVFVPIFLSRWLMVSVLPSL